MKPRVVDWLVCPMCQTGFEISVESARTPAPSTEASPPSRCRRCHAPAQQRSSAEENCADCYGTEVETGTLRCATGHAFPITNGIPRLSLDALIDADSNHQVDRQSRPARTIRASFSREWRHFDYDDTTWGWDVAERCRLFLKEVDLPAEALRGKLVLDAGCGNGSLSRALNAFGCEVLAADVSNSVDRAYRYFATLGNDRTHFVQADLMNPPFRPGAFDVVYSSGVLHHTPDTRMTLRAVAPALAAGGTIYVWLYGKTPGTRFKLKQVVRRAVAALPGPLKHGVMWAWLGQSLARMRLRRALGRGRPEDNMTWRELMVLLFDIYTPRYRWEHTPDELEGWYRELGLTNPSRTDDRQWGFGVAARKEVSR